jgi:hypothetical protein
MEIDFSVVGGGGGGVHVCDEVVLPVGGILGRHDSDFLFVQQINISRLDFENIIECLGGSEGGMRRINKTRKTPDGGRGQAEVLKVGDV